MVVGESAGAVRKMVTDLVSTKPYCNLQNEVSKQKMKIAELDTADAETV